MTRLKVKIRNELLLLNLLNIALLIIVILLPGSWLRVILGFPFILFFPGYSAVSALFPSKDAINAMHRLMLSFALSIAIVPLVLLVLNFTWGISLNPILYSINVFTAVSSTIAWLRRIRRPISNRFSPEFNISIPGWKSFWQDDTPNRVVSIILVLAILSAIGTLGYIFSMPEQGEKFTEFYILGEAGKAMSYPKTLRAGQQATVIIGISNHERSVSNYQLEVMMNEVKYKEIGPVILANGETWEDGVTFSSDTIATNQKIQFFLYKNEGAEPYLDPLHIWFDVVR